MSANPCGCDPEADHLCESHKIKHLEEMVQVLQDDLAEMRKERDILQFKLDRLRDFDHA